MTGVRGSAHHTLAAPARLTVRPITLALAASGGDDQTGAAESARVTPSQPLTAGDIQRSQPPGVNGPGARA